MTSGSQVSSALPVSDIDNDELTYTLVEQANKGIVTLTDTGFVYQANAGTTGTDTFLISVSDADADGESVDVPVTVNISAKVEPATSSASGGGSINIFLSCLLLFIYLSRASMSQQRVNRNFPRQ